jgi:hypothetical protein
VSLFDLDLVWLAGTRLFAVFVVWQTIWMGAMFRHTMRVNRWSPPRIRLVTAATWVVVVAEVGVFVNYSRPLFVLFVLGEVVFMATLLLYDRILAAISVRADPRMGLLAEISRILGDLANADSPADRERIDRDLAALDRWVTPKTFEFIQLTRSRVLAWLDGGPRQAGREARWSARMQEIVDVWFPPHTGRLTRLVAPFRGWLLANETLLSVVGGIVLGVSVAIDPLPVLPAPIILLGWLATWGTRRVVWVGLIGVSVGLVIAGGAIAGRPADSTQATVIATIALVEVFLLAAAWTYRRMSARSGRARLRLVEPAADKSAEAGPLTLDDYRGRPSPD